MMVGELRERVDFLSLSDSLDSQGGSVQTWTTVAASVWAKISADQAFETFRGMQQDHKRISTITVRYRSDITPRMRVGCRKVQLHNPGSEGPGDGNGTTVDLGAAITTGGLLTLSVESGGIINGFSYIQVNHSSDNFASDNTMLASLAAPPASGTSYSASIAPGTTIKRYVRVVWHLPGSTCSFSVGLSTRFLKIISIRDPGNERRRWLEIKAEEEDAA